MLKVILFTVFALLGSATEGPTTSILYLGFLQISNNGSGQDDGGMSDHKKVLIIFLINLIGCILVCALIQGVVIFSKKMNTQLIIMRKNYRVFTDFKKFNEIKNNYLKQNSSSEIPNNN